MTTAQRTADSVDAVLPEATGAYLRTVLGRPLSDEQLAAVTAPLQPQLVVAGAGSGKTTVMAARVVHAVAFHGVPASAVLGLTFTNKAAAELGERVRDALAKLAAARRAAGLAADDGTLPVDDMPTVSTYHAYAAGLVTDHALRIGREPDPRLLTEAARWQLALRVARSARGPFQHLNWTTPYVAQCLLDLDGEMGEHLVTADDVRAVDATLVRLVEALDKPVKDVAAIAATARTRDELLRLVDDYRTRKRELDAVDFGDQVALAAEIAERCPEVGAAERERFAVVFLDEYQDTGVAQRRLLAALYGGGHPVTAVGDPHQSIYGWRGASAGNLLRFPEHFPLADGGRCAPAFLLTSYRNSTGVLAAANALSAPLRGTGALDVPQLAAPPSAPAGALRVAWHATAADEIAWVADEIAGVVAAGTAPRDVAVLCRRRADFAPLAQALTARDVPVEVVGLSGLLAMPEVEDVVAVLEVLAEPTANAALVRVLTGARWRIGPRDLAALGRRAALLCATGRRHVPTADDASGDAALADAAAAVDPCDVVALSDALADLGDPAQYDADAYRRLRAVADELATLRRVLGHPVVDIVGQVVTTIGLDVEIEASPARVAAARAVNLAAFADHAVRFEGIEGESDLQSFLAYIAAAREAEGGFDVGGVSAADTVKLLTVHKAKGLEWSVVAVPTLCADVFPSNQGRPRWTSRATALPHRLRGDRDDLPADPDLTSAGLGRFKDDCAAHAEAEERRLAYVAVTRAKDLLLASGHQWTAGRKTALDPSPYLQTVADVARDGAGDVVVWADEAEHNPLDAQPVPDVAWPAAFDPDAYGRRLDAAAHVVAALAGDAEADPPTLTAAERRLVDRWHRDTERLLDELTREQQRIREVVLPRTLTTSQVVRLAADPDGFARSLARPMPRKPSAAARRGTAFHTWVEHRFDVRPLLDTDDLPGAADDDVAVDPALDELQDAFARSAYADVRPHAVEAPFELVVGGRLVRGRIDAVYATDGGFDVVDYKTGLQPSDMAAAALQLAVYRLAWADLAGVPVDSVSAAFLYVRTGELVRPPLLDRDGLEALLTGDGDIPPAGVLAEAGTWVDPPAVATPGPAVGAARDETAAEPRRKTSADPGREISAGREPAPAAGPASAEQEEQLSFEL